MALRTILLAAAALALTGATAAVFWHGGPAGPGAAHASAPPEGIETRRGALVDEIVFTREADPGRITALIRGGTHHVYGQGLDSAAIFRQIQAAPGVGHHLSYGTSVELTFNPAEFDDGRLNPFRIPAIREAMNWLVDRRHIAEELFGGLAVPRYLTISTAFPDYARLAETARELELRYRHDPQRAAEVIATEMEALGARRVDGVWHYNGEPVRLTVLIRTEDSRERIGDYVANLLEDQGFETERLYRTADEASRIWIAGDPSAGRWHVYTGAWITRVIDRDAANNFSAYYTPSGRPAPLWQAYTPTPEFAELAERLERRDYATLEERRELMERALELSMRDSARVWLLDQLSVWPHAEDLHLAADLAGGISGSALWPFTIRFDGQIGGRVVFATPTMLTEPWNPVAGSNWIFDQMILRALYDSAVMPDPFTGLYWPQRIDAAEVAVVEGTPVTRTLEWVELETVPEIWVPEDAWIDWDNNGQRIVTVGEKHPEGLTARSRTVLRFEDGYLERRWHDGTRVSAADLVLPWVLSFVRADEESPLFDPSHVPTFDVYQRHFRGWRITATDPLTVEVYSDQVYPDAEVLVAARVPGAQPWHVLQLGIEAERRGELAFSSLKSDRMGVEWLNLVSGPSLEILRGYLEGIAAAERVPFPAVLEPWLRDGEAAERHAALQAWHRERGHFWVDDGPFYLHSVRPVEGSLVLRRFDDFPDPADKWLRFSEPRIPELDLDGPLVVEHGEPVDLTLAVTFGGAPYPTGEIEAVRFLLFDGDDAVALQGEAEPMDDGHWRIHLPAATLEALGTGANSLEVVVTTVNVALPAFATHAFATVPARGRGSGRAREGGAEAPVQGRRESVPGGLTVAVQATDTLNGRLRPPFPSTPTPSATRAAGEGSR